MNEPSVWDFFKALLSFKRDQIPRIPPLPASDQAVQARDGDELESDSLEHTPSAAEIQTSAEFLPEPLLQTEGSFAFIETEYRAIRPTPQKKIRAADLPWFTSTALFLALLAQRALEPSPTRSWAMGLALYMLAFTSGSVALFRKEWMLGEAVEQETPEQLPSIRWLWLFASLPLMLGAFISFGGTSDAGHRFTLFNTLLWLAATLAMVKAFLPPANWDWLRRLGSIRAWNIKITPFMLIFLAVLAVAVFYRVYDLAGVPPEMNSDHAEKLLDVNDVLNGQFHVFFPRNTGREALQFYLTAVVAKLFNTGVSFMSLKIGTVFAGLLTLPFIYLLGVEVGNRRVGLLAMLLAGIAFWPNILSRIALRFTLYPLFVAPALFFLLRGLRRLSIKDFVLSGIFLGIGLHGYTPIRILPFVMVAAVVIFVLHKQTSNSRQVAVYGLLVVTLVSLMVALPLIRYAVDYPDNFAFRAFSRVGAVEQGYQEPVWQIFLTNTWKAMIMPVWDDNNIWVVSVPSRPSLDLASAALYSLGFILLILRYLMKHRWQDLFLVLSVPMLMLPSILSLAFPVENPAPNRAGGAMVVIFVIAALAFDGILSTFRNRFSPSMGKFAAVSVAVILIVWSCLQNYDLVFRQYRQTYSGSSWNSSEIGEAIGNFARSFGSSESAWVVAYPHWVDTRLVGMIAGYPTKDYAIAPDDLASTTQIAGAKMFIINAADIVSIEKLQLQYPDGWLVEYQSKYENKNFWMYFVPPDTGASLP